MGTRGLETWMPSATNARKSEPPAGAQPFAADNVRGADALVRALAGGGAGAVPMPAIGHAASAQDRKAIKKAGRLLKQAVEALDARRFKASEALFDEGLALLDNPPSLLWCYRLVAASKAANYEYVVNNYQRIRALVSTEDEMVVVDRAWIDCLTSAGFLHEALREAEALLARGTRYQASIMSATGVIHARLGNLQKAIAIQKSVLEKEPSHILARWNLAIQQLEAGELPEAFDNYEVRWDWPDFPSERRAFAIPRWQGEALAGKRVLVWREQGIGDEIRFASILPDLIATGARITLECAPKLAALFRISFPDIEVRPDLGPDARKPKDYAGFDFEVPIGSLARHFRPTAAAMQAKSRPWLKRDGEIEQRLRADMNVAPHQPVIGLCWRSSNRNVQRNQQYVKAEFLAPLKLLGTTKFVCLQYDECREEVAAMREMGLPIYDFPAIDQMNDLVSASYLTGACDLVVTAGTATLELAAGLGVPTVLFGQSGSQIQLGTDGVPWHPATRFLPLDADDPIGVAKSVLFDWNVIATWAEKASTSGRPTDWRLSYPGAA
jgi:tetratricopeptide (TPR) repeat protein